MTTIERAIADKIRNFADELQSETDHGLRPLNLAGIIEATKKAISKASRGADEYIHFAWGNAYPSSFESYRGYYERLCLVPDCNYSASLHAKDFLKMCEETIGSTREGWKGGTYTMHGGSLVHVCGTGVTSDTRVVDVRPARYAGIEIVTAQFPE